MDPLLSRIQALSFPKQVAFAAHCAERLRREIDPLPEDGLPGESVIAEILDEAWDVATGEPVDTPRLLGLQRRFLDAAEVRTDTGAQVALYGSAIEQLIELILGEAERAALVQLISESMIDLVGMIYVDADTAEDQEEAWQRRALDRLQHTPGRTVTRAFFQSLREYVRGRRYVS
ncbi:MAG: hypothetical protein H6739_26125 [Alphaproteobacteria bacterium]|nr:hypothetical protein [Alphaproteobacteria bacterium]